MRRSFLVLVGLCATSVAVFGCRGEPPTPASAAPTGASANSKPASKTEYTEPEARRRALADGAGRAYFAGGCFWGVEHYFEKEPGVLAVTSGYTGGSLRNPSYQQVSSGTSGHAEVVEVLFDAERTDYEKLARLFFEIHDPTQMNRQGPDVGTQYRSAVYTVDESQAVIVRQLIDRLRTKGLDVVTEVARATEFWPAEDYHQDYYQRTGGTPYCHTRVKRF